MNKGKDRRSSGGEPAPPIKDEPGAEQRFGNILKRALNTPPPRKQASAVKGRAKPKK
jgi:hypothetical protein